jgi:hypothetical protein
MISIPKFCVVVIALACLSVSAQSSKTVDFSDLTSAGASSTRTFSVDGIRDESFKHLRSFAASDSDAREGIARRASERRASSNSNSTSSRESTPPPKAVPAEKVFVCTIYCNSASGPTISRRFSVKTRSEAAKQAGDQADQFCRADGYAKSSGRTFPESQCREG